MTGDQTTIEDLIYCRGKATSKLVGGNNQGSLYKPSVKGNHVVKSESEAFLFHVDPVPIPAVKGNRCRIS